MIWLANINSGPISANYNAEGQAVPIVSNISLEGYIWSALRLHNYLRSIDFCGLIAGTCTLDLTESTKFTRSSLPVVPSNRSAVISFRSLRYVSQWLCLHECVWTVFFFWFLVSNLQRGHELITVSHLCPGRIGGFYWKCDVHYVSDTSALCEGTECALSAGMPTAWLSTKMI
jgi:hypothetical protein